MKAMQRILIVAGLATAIHAARAADETVTPDVIFGSGVTNSSFTVSHGGGLELGLRGKLRFNSVNLPENTFNSNNDGTYSFTAGKAPTGFGFAPPPNNTPVWSFEWTVNVDPNDSTGDKLEDYTYEIGLDFDPGPGASFLAWDPITVPGAVPFAPPAAVAFWDHSCGDNSTPNGGGIEAGDVATYLSYLSTYNVAQNSWNYEFFNNSPFNTFDATVAGDYEIYLAAFSGVTEVARTTIHIIVEYPDNLLSLESDTCPDDAAAAAGHQVAVQVWMRNLQSNATGFQAFLQYDTARLDYRGDLSSYTSSPFPLHIQAIGTAEVTSGKLRLDGFSSFDPNDDGTGADSHLATLVFDVVGACSTTDVKFDPNAILPSELSYHGTPLTTSLLNTPAMTLDDTPPVMACPADTTVECDQPTDAASIGAGGHFQGFESPAYASGDPNDWNDYNSALARVVSGTDGIISRSGAAHAVIDSTVVDPNDSNDFTGAFSRLGGYDSTYGSGYRTALDIYMDLEDPAVLADTYGWDLSTAANNQSGSHRRDFIFHTASDPNGDILVGGSNNSNFTRRTDLASINHYTITSSGWYTFEWVFRDFGNGTLAVDLNLRDASGTLLWTETRNDSSDLLATVVGGHRYMWFTFLEVDKLAIDNTLFRDNVSATDNCDAAPYITSSDAVTLGACAGEKTISRTWTAMDDCNNVTTCVQTITVVDTTAPLVTAPSDVELECSGDLPAAETTIAGFLALAGASATDNCTDPNDLTVTSSTGALVGTECSGVITRTYTITDDCGNSASVDHVFNVSDDTDPIVTPPSDTELECSGDLPAAETTIAGFLALAGASATDNCTDPNDLTVTSSTGALVGTECSGVITRTYTITDDCGNSASVDHVFNVSDDTDPIVTPPTTVDLECSGDLPAAETTIAGFLALAGASATDNCTDPNDLTVTSSTGALVGTECSGVITRTYTITDDCGNATLVDHVFTVTDNTDPLLSPCPGDITQSADPGCTGAIVTWTDPTATDNCDATPDVVCVPASGSLFPIGTTTVTCTATDECGNTDTCSFDVTVTGVNEVDVTVVIDDVDATSSFQRCIKFVVKDALGQCGAAVHETMTFTGNPATATGTILAPCGDWVSMCVKDEQHTLYETVALTDSISYYTAATATLRSGDTDNDGDVDIHDVTWLLFTFGDPADDGGCPWNGDRDADFDNDGVVGTPDYDLLVPNWLSLTTCPCVVSFGGPDVDAIHVDLSGATLSTAELPPAVALKVDLNRDGMVDYRDVKLFESRHGLPNRLSTLMRAQP